MGAGSQERRSSRRVTNVHDRSDAQAPSAYGVVPASALLAANPLLATGSLIQYWR